MLPRRQPFANCCKMDGRFVDLNYSSDFKREKILETILNFILQLIWRLTSNTEMDWLHLIVCWLLQFSSYTMLISFSHSFNSFTQNFQSINYPSEVYITSSIKKHSLCPKYRSLKFWRSRFGWCFQSDTKKIHYFDSYGLVENLL